MKFTNKCLLLLPCFIFLLVACGTKDADEKIVVLYSSVDQTYTNKVILDFETETGIDVKLVSDTEAAKSSGLMNRLISEKKRPVADVFWSGDPIRAKRLVQLGVGEEIKSEGAAWRFRLLIIHDDTTAENPRRDPISLFDLAKPEWAPYSCIANPQFGTTSMHLAVLYEVYGENKVNQFLKRFTENGGKMVASNGEVRRRVSSGEFLYGLTDSDDYSVAVKDEKKVRFIIPDKDKDGVLVIPTVPVKIKDCPNGAEADRLIEYLLSEKLEEIMSECDAAHIPFHPQVLVPPLFDTGIMKLKKMTYDKEKVVKRIHEMSDFIDHWVSAQQSL